MDVETDPTTPRSPHDSEAEVLAFLSGRSAPCPRCAYDLRDIRTAMCPECGEPLVLTIGSPRAHFGWLVLAMAPGCFSGVTAVFVMIPIAVATLQNFPGPPWPIVAADAFGFLSAGSVWLMYRHRHRFMSWAARRQTAFAAAVWAIHVLMLALVIFSMWYLIR
ncbi:MAG: hypothetical protein KF745_06490 [Phycisphaeraceae bacterium]|nr:hypothetical protein [Phycisphaeraceae bacterium]